ncbi:hypothetical protein niasHT_016182 [Heterodera trifolii]|uniref:Presequence protease, mitochondrial n=1 Tax=Heterodera trifolii TaxID=157864 RepID=A0ABD2KVW9_9BILA
MVWTKKAMLWLGGEGEIPLTVYNSDKSKICVFIAETSGPMIHGRISFVTETHTNDGLPHTLEHLVFMGSQLYPYKGMLDLIANRCLASGTNAYTYPDHTAYELHTAGSSGFLKLLPVFLDHLLHPTLTQSQYDTEVHHINGEGKNSGVTYCEVQALDGGMDFLLEKKRRELFYPAESGYCVMAGGTLSGIRELCSLKRVKDFHKDFYHLSNMYITVCGNINNHHELLDVFTSIENERQNLDAIPQQFDTPFQTLLPPLTESKTARIVCPSDNDASGMVEMSWHGPPGSDFKKTQALTILCDYIADYSSSSLSKNFVDGKFCTSVSFYLKVQRYCEIVASFEGVPVAKLDEISDRFEKTVVDHKLPVAFNVMQIGFVLDQQIQHFHLKLENRSTSLIFAAVSSHQLFGREEDPDYTVFLKRCLDQADVLEQLKNEAPEFWHDLFTEFFVDKKYVCVMAEPSREKADEDEKMEKARIQEQIITIGGEEGLKKQKKRLDDAIAENTRKHPWSAELDDLSVHNWEEFDIINVSTSTNVAQQPDDFVSKFPFTAALHDLKSKFFEATIVIDTGGIRVEDRHFLLLWFELMYISPALVGEDVLNYKEVAKLSRVLASRTISVGFIGEGAYDRFVALRLRTAVDSVSNLAKWADIFLNGVYLDKVQVLVAARNLVNNAAERKQDGSEVCTFLDACSSYPPGETAHFCSDLGLERLHQGVVEALESGNFRPVLARLREIRRHMLAAPMNVHFSGDPSRIRLSTGPSSAAEDMAAQWAFFRQEPVHQPLECPADYGVSEAQFGQSRAIVVRGADTAFWIQKTRFDDDWNGPSTMSTLLLAQYLQQCEGPLWNAVRGPGYAYGVNLDVLPDRKALSLDLYRCSELIKAYQQTRATTLAVLNLDRLDTNLLESAKRSLIFNLISRESTVELRVNSAILATIRSVGNNFTRDFCYKIWYAKAEDVLAIGSPPIRRLFDPKQSFRSIALNPSRVAELREHFPEQK